MKYLASFSFFMFTILSFSQNSNQEIGAKFIKLLLEEKNFHEAYSFFDESVKVKISEKLLEDADAQLGSQLGKFERVLEVNKENKTYFYYSGFEKMKIDVKITFNEEDKIIGFFFSPHKEFSTEKSLGKELVIKSGTIALKGTVLVPENNNLKKLVVFVHGSGPQDRDETIYENKPFKDIAEGLYKKGIASYRFDKRTLSNPETFNDKSTIDDEVTNDILNIIKYFKDDSQFKAYEIIVLGHSLGANVMPRIANQSNQIAKIILLAGNARPLEVLVAEQYDHLYQLDPTPELFEGSKKIKEQIAVLKSKEFNLNTPKENLPFNLSAYYWKSILDYKPLQEVKKVKLPILILQGERDYQVTMKDFQLWKEALKNNNKATLTSYPKLNHLFIAGEGISGPKEYMIKGHVDENVINDIAVFIN